MRSVSYLAKRTAQSMANRFGYRIEAIRDTANPIDVFELIMQRLLSIKAEPYFVQVGAYDGVADDPLRPFILHYPLRGILLEPQPRVFQRLIANYQGRENLEFENAAISDHDGTATFYTVKDGEREDFLASFHKSIIRRRIASDSDIQEISVRTMTFGSLIEKHRISDIDILQIDAEGYDADILRMFDFNRMQPTVVRFECFNLNEAARKDCARLLMLHDYRLMNVGLDTIAYRPQVLP